MTNLNQYLNSFIIIICLALCSSCVERMSIRELNLDGSGDIAPISIEGVMRGGASDTVFVKVRKTIELTGLTTGNTVDNALLWLTQDDNSYELTYDEKGRLFKSVTPVLGEAGQSFTLHVVYNEVEYTATETIPKAPEGDVMPDVTLDDSHNYYKLWRYDHSFGYKNTEIWTSPRLYMYRSSYSLLRSFGMFGNSNGMWVTHKGEKPKGGFDTDSEWDLYIGRDTEEYRITEIPIARATISKEYERYLWEYYNVTRWNREIDSGTSATPTGNFSNGALGYFYALNIKLTEYELEELPKR